MDFEGLLLQIYKSFYLYTMTAEQYHLQGLEAQKNEAYDEAVALFTKALETSENPNIYNDRGVCLFHLNRKEEALVDFNKAVALEPDYSYRYASRAFIKDSLGDTEGAVEDYRKAVKLDPKDAVAYNNLGMLEEKLGYKEMSKKNLAKADKLAEEQGLFPEQEAPSSLTEQEEHLMHKEIEGMLGEVEAQDRKEAEQKAGAKEHARVMMSVFRSKSALREFIQFIKKGFKS